MLLLSSGAVSASDRLCPSVWIKKQAESALLYLARIHTLTVYDASYLELALRLRLPLATLNRQFISAAEGRKHQTGWENGDVDESFLLTFIL